MKTILSAVGWAFVGLAALGVMLPLLPTVPFLLVAAACFAHSSPRFHAWLLNHRVFGEPIRHWQASRSIPKKSKYMALTTLVVSGAVSLFLINGLIVKMILIVLLSIPMAILIRLPNSEDIQ